LRCEAYSVYSLSRSDPLRHSYVIQRYNALTFPPDMLFKHRKEPRKAEIPCEQLIFWSEISNKCYNSESEILEHQHLQIAEANSESLAGWVYIDPIYH